jgi:hypothetical protein
MKRRRPALFSALGFGAARPVGARLDDRGSAVSARRGDRGEGPSVGLIGAFLEDAAALAPLLHSLVAATGTLVASAGMSIVKLWDAATGQFSRRVVALATSPDGNTIAAFLRVSRIPDSNSPRPLTIRDRDRGALVYREPVVAREAAQRGPEP